MHKLHTNQSPSLLNLSLFFFHIYIFRFFLSHSVDLSTPKLGTKTRQKYYSKKKLLENSQKSLIVIIYVALPLSSSTFMFIFSNLFSQSPFHPSVGQWSERNTLVFDMLGVTGSGPRCRKPENFRKGRLDVQAHAQQRILMLLGNGFSGLF